MGARTPCLAFFKTTKLDFKQPVCEFFSGPFRLSDSIIFLYEIVGADVYKRMPVKDTVSDLKKKRTFF